MANRYHDGGWLRQKYVDERVPAPEIAEICGVSDSTIYDWMDRHNIGRRGRTEAQLDEGKQNDEKWLREQYVDKRRSMADIADEVDMSPSGIKKALDRAGIETRSAVEHHRYGPCSFMTDKQTGYESVGAKYNYEKDQCRVHQLVAIAKGANPYKVFSNGRYHVHHKNRIPWDNRPENLELKSGQVHTREHGVDEERVIPDSYDSNKTKQELLSDLRNLIVDWRDVDNSAVEMCADELDALLAG